MKGNKKILLIEDDNKIRSTVSDILKLEGFTVISVESVEEAQKYIDSVVIDLIITDIMLPGKSGLEFLEELQSVDKFVKVPIILLSARCAIEDIRTGMHLGADDYIPKPFEIEDLLKAINIRLDKFKKIKNCQGGLSSLDNNVEADEREKFDNILFIQASNQYSLLHFDDGTMQTVAKPLKKWELRLNKNKFIRVNRTYIINKDIITSYLQTDSTEMKIFSAARETPFRVSRRRIKEVKAILQKLGIKSITAS